MASGVTSAPWPVNAAAACADRACGIGVSCAEALSYVLDIWRPIHIYTHTRMHTPAIYTSPHAQAACILYAHAHKPHSAATSDWMTGVYAYYMFRALSDMAPLPPPPPAPHAAPPHPTTSAQECDREGTGAHKRGGGGGKDLHPPRPPPTRSPNALLAKGPSGDGGEGREGRPPRGGGGGGQALHTTRAPHYLVQQSLHCKRAFVEWVEGLLPANSVTVRRSARILLLLNQLVGACLAEICESTYQSPAWTRVCQTRN